MREQAKIFLGIIRDANRQNILLDQRVFDIIVKNLEINQQELVEVTEILEADLLEKVAMKPEFDAVKDFIRRKGRT